MIDASLALAFSAGMVATVNPCGFAMLPAYLAYFLGVDDEAQRADGGSAVLGALGVSVAVTAGFLVVFGAMGVVWSSFSSAIAGWLPWVTMVIGVGLVALAVAMLRGFEPNVRLPKLEAGGHSRRLGSMFLFGVSYAVASLSCTIGIFVAVVSTTFRQSNLASGVATFVMYGLGMGLVITVLTVAVAAARGGVVRRFRQLLPHVQRISAGFLLVAGAYVAYHGWYEWQVTRGNLDPGGPGGWFLDRQADLQQWINDVGPVRLGLALAVVVGGAVAIALVLRSQRRPGAGASAGSAPGGPEQLAG